MDTRKFSQYLVTAFNERKTFAFSRFYASYHAPVTHLVKQQLGTMPGAEDLVNDIFLKMYYLEGKNFETVRNIERYLGRTARSECRDFLKKEKTPEVKMNGIRAYIKKIENEDIEKTDDKRVAKTLVAMATEMLPGKCRDIFILSQERGLKNKEIAELLNISEKTVENQINIARNKLREQCKKDGINMYYINLLLPILCSQLGSN
jgi:RNA polymerase sigma factor (sigma-70 family)